MAAPCALVASCCDYQAEELVRQILDREDLPESSHVLEDIHSYPWHIDTKYYAADIRLCTTTSKTIGDEQFSETVQAIILYFDSTKENSFQLVKSWQPFVDQLEPNVQILVCERCTQNDVVSRSRVLEWCLDHGFELVELAPEQFSDEEDEEDEFKETVGIKRVIQALYAHTWSNLTMKEVPSFHSQYLQQLKAEEEAAAVHADHTDNEPSLSSLSLSDKHTDSTHTAQQSSGVVEQQNGGVVEQQNGGVVEQPGTDLKDGAESGQKVKSQQQKTESAADRIDSMFSDDDKALFSGLTNDDDDDESFEALFSRMREMKETAERLPPDERKAYAEKVAISFWKAIGGDEEEIDGLVDSD